MRGWCAFSCAVREYWRCGDDDACFWAAFFFLLSNRRIRKWRTWLGGVYRDCAPHFFLLMCCRMYCGFVQYYICGMIFFVTYFSLELFVMWGHVLGLVLLVWKGIWFAALGIKEHEGFNLSTSIIWGRLAGKVWFFHSPAVNCPLEALWSDLGVMPCLVIGVKGLLACVELMGYYEADRIRGSECLAWLRRMLYWVRYVCARTWV